MTTKLGFSSYVTAWDEYVADGTFRGDRTRAARLAFYIREMTADMEDRKRGTETYLQHMDSIVLATEHTWYESDKPYYKVWPAYLLALLNTRLSVPVGAFRTPYKAFSIHLPRLEGFTSALGQGTALLVGNQVNKLVCFVECEGRARAGLAVLDLTCGETLEECLLANPERVDDACLNAALSLAVGVSLLAVSVHRYVEHDVIAALRERYSRTSSTAEKEVLAEKSRRRGVHGWCIGRGRDLSLTTDIAQEGKGASNRSLTWQHIRGGHFHTYRCGVGRCKWIVRWTEPTIVRPDLPPAPLDHTEL